VVAEEPADQVLDVGEGLTLAATDLEMALGDLDKLDVCPIHELEQLARSPLNELGTELDRFSRRPNDGVHPPAQTGACLQQENTSALAAQPSGRRQACDSATDHHHVPGHRRLLILLVAERDDGIEP
jgi:hypothetical protein